MSEKKINDGFSINQILSKANDENERSISVDAPDFEALRESAIESSEAEGAAEASVSDSEDFADGADKSEEEQLIDEYSGKEKLDPRSNTQRLRDMLAAKLNDDSELAEYYNGTKTIAKSKKVEEIYSIINSDKLPEQMPEQAVPEPAPARKEIKPVEPDEARFSDADKLPKKDSFVQEKLFSFGDTAQFEVPDKADEHGKATFDDDYEELSAKIISGELTIEKEEVDSQLTLGVDGYEQEEQPMEDTKDINLRIIFDMMDKNEELPEEMKKLESGKIGSDMEASSKVRRKKTKRAVKDSGQTESFEYTSREQNSTVYTMLARAVKLSRLKLIAVVLLTIGIFYLETATYGEASRSVFLRPGRYGALYILVDLQLLFFIAMIMLVSIKNGFKAISEFKLTTDSVLALAITVPSLFCVVCLIFNPTYQELRLYNLMGAAAAVASSFIKYLQCKKDQYCFKIVASNREKFAAEVLGSDAGEAGEFYKYLVEDSVLYTVKRTDFVSGFFKRINKRPESEDILNLLMPFILILSVALFGVCFLLGNGVFESYAYATMLFCTACPLTAFFMISLPTVAANIVGKKKVSAFIGTAVAEEYADASVLSFADTEVFPAHLVNITSIKTYGNNPVDEVMTKLGMLFDYLEGPLKTVISNMVDRIPKPSNVRLIDASADGLYITMDGKDYYLGKRSYMRHNRLEAPVDETDEVYAKNVGSVMYMAINDAVVAKIYVKYSINPEFDDLLAAMYRADICVGIKTLDPNINNELLAKGIKFKKCPIAILKAGTPESMNGKCEAIDTGIVTNDSLHTFLKMFIVCDKARHATKSNGIVNIASIILAVFTVAFLAITGAALSFGSATMLLFQFLWLIPVFGISFLL